MNAIFLFGLLALAVFSWFDLRENRIRGKWTLLFILMTAVFRLGTITTLEEWMLIYFTIVIIGGFVIVYHSMKNKWVMGGADFKVLAGLSFLSPTFIYFVPIGLIIWVIIFRAFTKQKMPWTNRYPGIPAFLIAWLLTALI